MANFVRFTAVSGVKVTVNAEHVSHIEHKEKLSKVVMSGGAEYDIAANRIESLESYLNKGDVPDIG